MAEDLAEAQMQRVMEEIMTGRAKTQQVVAFLQVLSRKGMMLDREKFEKLKDEYYVLRGWDVASGRQTAAMLTGLGLPDIARDLGQRGLIAEGAKVLV